MEKSFGKHARVVASACLSLIWWIRPDSFSAEGHLLHTIVCVRCILCPQFRFVHLALFFQVCIYLKLTNIRNMVLHKNQECMWVTKKLFSGWSEAAYVTLLLLSLLSSSSLSSWTATSCLHPRPKSIKMHHSTCVTQRFSWADRVMQARLRRCTRPYLSGYQERCARKPLLRASGKQGNLYKNGKLQRMNSRIQDTSNALRMSPVRGQQVWDVCVVATEAFSWVSHFHARIRDSIPLVWKFKKGGFLIFWEKKMDDWRSYVKFLRECSFVKSRSFRQHVTLE